MHKKRFLIGVSISILIIGCMTYWLLAPCPPERMDVAGFEERRTELFRKYPAEKRTFTEEEFAQMQKEAQKLTDDEVAAFYENERNKPEAQHKRELKAALRDCLRKKIPWVNATQ